MQYTMIGYAHHFGSPSDVFEPIVTAGLGTYEGGVFRADKSDRGSLMYFGFGGQWRVHERFHLRFDAQSVNTFSGEAEEMSNGLFSIGIGMTF
ncbi:MAG: hypothetical protein ACI835_002153 [Planctomycetota bacterium]|jgi:hypothetical protein